MPRIGAPGSALSIVVAPGRMAGTGGSCGRLLREAMVQGHSMEGLDSSSWRFHLYEDKMKGR